jgi:hypothetical protein
MTTICPYCKQTVEIKTSGGLRWIEPHKHKTKRCKGSMWNLTHLPD